MLRPWPDLHVHTVANRHPPVLVIAMMLDVTFWTAWFIDPRLISDDTSEAFMHYENAFPLGHLLVLITVLLAYLALRNPGWVGTATSAHRSDAGICLKKTIGGIPARRVGGRTSLGSPRAAR